MEWRSAQGLRILAFWGVLCGLAAAAKALPIRTWSINFNDPTEPTRWRFDPSSRDSDTRLGSPSEQVRWGQVPRSSSKSSGSKILQFSATSKLSVETYFSIFRAFPPEFQPDPSSDLALEWEWRLGDTELSGAVSIFILRARPDGGEPDTCFGVDGHTKFTAGWPVFFDSANRWIHHRVTLPNGLCHSDSQFKPIGIVLMFVSPVRQSAGLASLKVEEWPHGELAADPIFGPHHSPLPDLPFEVLPFDRLRRSTAGAIEDLDGDGLPELLVLERRGYAHLYRNRGGGSEFEEITKRAGLAQPTMGTGAMFLDLDSDGDRDLLLTSEFDVPRFFENLGDLRFRERHLLDDRHLSFWYGVAADDIDHDGDPDLFFVSPIASNFLFLRNLGGWHLKAEPLFDLRELAQRAALNFSASLADLNDDGWPDMFLGREYLFRNSSGRLKLQSKPWRAVDRIQTEGGIWADLTGDGRLDLLILRDSTENLKGSSRLMEGREGGGFVEITSSSGLPPLESAEVALAEDFDNDGDPDLYLCQRDRPNYLLLNDGRGHFDDATESSGFSETGGCDAALAADMNGDGGLDIVILRYGSSPAILFNQLVRGRWLGIILEGKPGTEAIGARVRVLDAKGGTPITVRWVRRGQGFGSVGPAELRFGLGSRRRADVEIRFPSGKKRLLKAVRADSTLLVSEDGGGLLSTPRRWIFEARFPFVRSFRRSLPTSSSLSWLIAGLAFLAGLPLFSKPLRPLSILGLAGGALTVSLLGSIPGRGLAGSPPSLWVLGSLAGILVPMGTMGFTRLTQFLRRRSRDPVLQREDLIRFTHDFRHAGIEARALFSIHSRAQNLFLSSEPHPPFLSALRELAASYPRATGARLRTLLELSHAVFPDLSEAVRLGTSEHRLEELLGEFPRLADEAEFLSRWRDQILPVLQETKAALEALLVRLDLLCSCEIRDVLGEVCAAQEEVLRRAGVTLHVTVEGTGSFQALITRESLLMILDNLFTNSLAVLGSKDDPRIEMNLRNAEQQIALRFSDNGPGIPQGLAEKIFQYGFSTRLGGKGYGLARSRELLGHFGGGMALEATDTTAGATFLISLRPVSST